MSRLAKVLSILPVALLAGCTLFYPNWGATALPDDSLISESPTESSGSSETPLESPTATSTPSPSGSGSPSPSDTILRNEVSVEIVMAVVESDLDILTVVAQVPGVTDETGACSLTFLADSFEKTFSVSAEQSSDFMQCAPFEIDLAELPSGSGLVTVTFDSDRYFGRSGASSVVIP